MRIQPRQQLVDLWRAILDSCYVRDPESADPDARVWIWGGTGGANSISDAEQLLCLLYPATQIATFALDQPDNITGDVRDALEPFGTPTRIGGVVVGLLEQFFERHAENGEPVFAAGSYLGGTDGIEPTADQYRLELVDSFSMSLSLCIAALRFLRGFEGVLGGEVRREAKLLRPRIAALEPVVRARLTAAMVGLVRSFVIHTPEPRSAAGRAMLQMLNRGEAASDAALAAIAARLERLRVQTANEVRLAQSEDIDVADDRLLFECGWTWGVSSAADAVDLIGHRIATTPGVAESRPYLYFTVVALDGILDLLSEKIKERDLLDDTQRQLANALKLRLELTQKYWSTVARFSPGHWPLEDFPWRTSDGEESDYYSLAVGALLMQDMIYRESTDDLVRTVAVFDQLARRGRITSRLTAGDPAAVMHSPGVPMRLVGSEHAGDGTGPRLLWQVPDFATMMLKRCLQAAGLPSSVDTRDRLLELADSAMDHLDARMLRHGAAAGLWDDTSVIAGSAATNGAGPFAPDRPSWFITERMMECFVIAYDTFSQPPLAPEPMIKRAVESLSEAEHLLNQERLEVGDDDQSAKRVALDRIEQSLERARSVLGRRPATALSLATQALAQLDELAYARENATR
ncbi:SCO2524 family protein [Nocardia stercoris]|uniref:Uncharacterized protein n=1 Tax=Nocardia stercoris TaxID=2483361 RepID=A0A3M2L9C2_9NOCA|nr:SCO2524 family protein [Nocardia stercoris]RMI33646.1 hypothetical protein EBN03_08720 [Nocardia stercoris]